MKFKLAVQSLALVAGVIAAPTPSTFAEASEPPSRSHVPRMSYVENGTIRLGIDLTLGGAITYLAPTTNQELNVINSHDWGRQVQLSYYSGPNPFQPPGATMATNWGFLGWNPIQSGDCYGFKSQVVQHTNTGRSLYTKLIPMQWPLKNVPGECECEVWLELDGPVVQARCRLTNHRADHTQYRARSQELPAVYVNAPFNRLMTYRGDQPFTGDALAQVPGQLQDYRWPTWVATENWAAQVNEAGWGLGIWQPAAFAFSGGFAGTPGVGGPKDASTGYIAPTRPEILDHNIVYDYHYMLILGTVDEIRAQVYRRAPRPPTLTYRFEQDRQGWYYADATDTGWPVRGELDVRLDGPHPQVFSPSFFLRAEAAPVLTLEAAFATGRTNATVFWRTFGKEGFDATQAQTFPVPSDGQFHRYQIRLAESPAYRGVITQLRLDAVAAGDKAAGLRLKSVTLGK